MLQNDQLLCVIIWKIFIRLRFDLGVVHSSVKPEISVKDTEFIKQPAYVNLILVVNTLSIIF